jgi:hypothetical protein
MLNVTSPRRAARARLSLALTAFAAAVLPAVAGAEQLFGTNGTTISRFDTTTLGTVTTVAVTGLQAGESIIGIDVRPASVNAGTGALELFAITSNSRMYIVSPTTGIATSVGSAGAFTLNGTAFGTDFNPTVDRIRQVSNTEQNLRLNPNNGALAATDTALSPAGNIVGVAYDRNDTDPATGTTLFGIDSAAGTLVTIGGVNGTPSPNAGGITTVGSLGLGTNLNENIGFDISGSGTGYASITTAGISRLYTINLTTGTATLASSNGGSIGGGTTPFLGLAAANAPEPGSVALIALAGAAGLASRRRGRRA